MAKMNKALSFETTFGTYIADELLGEGGAGRVYGAIDSEKKQVAIKVLAGDRATTDKRRRFKNEIAFLQDNKHKNIVTVIDHGISQATGASEPFYVMQRYDGNLRDIMKGGLQPNEVMPLFSQILDGVEAAHLQKVVHRDLKPENILWNKTTNALAVADFGIARFAEDLLVTLVQTDPAQRLANFQYAAPEQRVAGRDVGAAADIYALGLMLNEMFTGEVPHGAEPRAISQVAPEHGFLDLVVTAMRKQSPNDRPGSIAAIKNLIQRHQSEAISLQRLSQIDETVIKSNEIDDPLAEAPPRLIDADWDGGQLTLTLDRPVTPEWVDALHRMGRYNSVLGKPPQMFSFQGNKTSVPAREHEVQAIIDHFKQWLPTASQTLKNLLEEAARRDEAAKREQLRREREVEEQRLRIRRNIKI